MTRDEALSLMDEYVEVFKGYCEAPHSVSGDDASLQAAGMTERFPEGGSEAKAMRWLGYIQGLAVGRFIYTLEEVKIHSENRTIVEVYTG
jgi:hypothetical protein